MSDSVSTVAPPQALPAPWSIEVTAHQLGTYPQRGNLNAWMRQPGDRFVIKSMDDFSPAWMTLDGQEPAEAGFMPSGNAIVGHGPRVGQPENIPLTTVSNKVLNPIQVMNETADANRRASRGR